MSWINPCIYSRILIEICMFLQNIKEKRYDKIGRKCTSGISTPETYITASLHLKTHAMQQ